MKGNKIDMQKSIAFIYPNNKLLEDIKVGKKL